MVWTRSSRKENSVDRAQNLYDRAHLTKMHGVVDEMTKEEKKHLDSIDRLGDNAVEAEERSRLLGAMHRSCACVRRNAQGASRCTHLVAARVSLQDEDGPDVVARQGACRDVEAG